MERHFKSGTIIQHFKSEIYTLAARNDKED